MTLTATGSSSVAPSRRSFGRQPPRPLDSRSVTVQVLPVIAERCEECRFDGAAWTDTEAMEAIALLPARWRDAVSGLASEQLHRRPIAEMWSIAEYADHVREVLFGMRFVLDTALMQPGTDLGKPPEPRFDPEPRAIEIEQALSGIDREAAGLRDRLAELGQAEWNSPAIVDRDEIDARWVARHAVHDATHHLQDVGHLREAL
jgi:hypothetical protein